MLCNPNTDLAVPLWYGPLPQSPVAAINRTFTSSRGGAGIEVNICIYNSIPVVEQHLN